MYQFRGKLLFFALEKNTLPSKVGYYRKKHNNVPSNALPKKPETPNPFYELGRRTISVLIIPGLCTNEWSKNAVSLSCYFSFISTDR